MFFSIIVPIFNARKYIEECLQSIKNQSFQDFEVILIDDGSNDGSSDICDQFAILDKRFRSIHKRNEGVAKARNLGILSSVGKFLCFIDADDFLDSDYLNIFFKTIIENKDVDIIQVGFRNYPSKKECIPFPKIYSSFNEFVCANKTPFSSPLFSFSWRCCFRKQFLDDHSLMFFPNMRYGEDSLFNLTAISKAKQIICIDKIAYNYRIDNLDSSSRNYIPTLISDMDLYHQGKMKASSNLSNEGKKIYFVDMARTHLFKWIPACVNNLKHSSNGFKMRDAKRLARADFVQDTAHYYLKNKMCKSKIQKIYLRLITMHFSMVLFFIWKSENLERFID